MTDRKKVEKVIQLYFKPPFKPMLIMESLENLSLPELNGVVVSEIIPDVISFLQDREKVRKDYKKRDYIRDLTDALVDADFLTLKKKSYAEFMRDSLCPPESRNKTNEDYRREHQEYLQNTLIPTDKNKNFTKLI